MTHRKQFKTPLFQIDKLVYKAKKPASGGCGSRFGAAVLSVRDINRCQLQHGPPQAGHPPRTSTRPTHPSPPLHGQVNRGHCRVPVPAQERWAFTPHPRPYAAQAGTIRRDRRSRGSERRRRPADAWHRNVVDRGRRRQRGGIYAPPERTCPIRAGGQGGQLDRPALLTNRPHKTAKRRMAFFSAFFLVFAFAERRRTAPRFYPTPCEMNVKRGSKPTAELTKNQRKT